MIGQLDLDLELVAVDGREELLDQVAGDGEAGKRNGDGDEDSGQRVTQGESDQAFIQFAEERDGYAVGQEPPPSAIADAPVDEGGDRRQHGQRQEEGKEDREDNRDAERADEFAGIAGHDDQRQEGQRRRQRGGEQRNEEMAHRLADGRPPVEPLAPRLAVIVDGDDGVVDQQAERDDETAERDLVQRHADHVEREHHHQQGQR